MKRAASAAPLRDLSRPAISIAVGGTALPAAVALRVARVAIDEDAGLPAMFAIELAGGDDQDETAWIDGAFPIGAAVQISLGYQDALRPVLAAEVTGIEPVFLRDRPPSLTVRGHDLRHRLLRRRNTRSFVQARDSEIADEVLTKAALGRGLQHEVKKSSVVREYVLQANQTDLEFLQQRAALIQYEIVIEAGTLHFRPLQTERSEALVLTPEDDLLEFYPCLSAMRQFSKLQVRGWRPQEKNELAGRAPAAGPSLGMGGGTSGAAIAASAFGASEDVVCDVPTFTQAEADDLARAQFSRAALEFISGEGVCSGRTDLHPGQLIRIDGIGKRFSGLYYVASASHRYSRGGAYHTHFGVQRNAA